MKVTVPSKEQLDEFMSRGVEKIFPSKKMFSEMITSGKRLRIYNGIDPTGPTLHIGHMLSLQKLGVLQSWGHEVILLIGSFTAMIGDPTGKVSTRSVLTREQVLENAKVYQEQAKAFLSFEGKNAAKLAYNNEWFDEMSFQDVLSFSSKFTVAQLLERDMFQNRIQKGAPVFVHELMYPMMQGYDSVALEVDMEIGGNDQTFNMLAGRDLLKEQKKEKIVLATKILADATGKKIGKTEGNMIALSDSAKDMFGKVMSWADEMIIPGFEMCTPLSMQEIIELNGALKSGEKHPMDAKKLLGYHIVKLYKGEKEAKKAKADFEHVFQKKEDPTEVPEIMVSSSPMNIVDLLVETKLAKNKSEAKRFVTQRGVKVNHEIIDDWKQEIVIGKDALLIQRGKRFFAKVILK